ncbi:response regulator [Burkholderiaceae bacterium UC74_6]
MGFRAAARREVGDSLWHHDLVKILLVDDHRLLAEALADLIQVRFPSCAITHAFSLAEALSKLTDDVRLVLLDLGLPDASGLEAVRAVRAHAQQARIVVLSADDRAETVRSAIELGASGFVPKQAKSDQLLRALSAVLDGSVTLPATAVASLTAESGVPASHGEDLGLTPRQRDVLRLLIEGLPNKLISRSLGLSESSVKTHLDAIYRRLGVSSRTQAVLAVARLGLRFKPPEVD